MATLELNLLGTFDGFRENQRLRPGQMGIKVCALLAYLAVESSTKDARRYPRSRLAALLWPQSNSEQKARNSLSQALYRLRNAIGDHDRPEAQQVVCWDRQAIWLNPAETIRLDVAEFLQHVRDRNRASLEQAVALYRDDFLVDIVLPDCDEFEGWVLLVREMVRIHALSAMEIVADRAIRNREWGVAQEYARSQLELERYREIAHRQLMTVLAMQGQRETALAQYERCLAALVEEFGAEPDRETQSLAQQIRSGALSWNPVDLNEVAPDAPAPVVSPSSTRNKAEIDKWSGIIDLNPDGLALIQGYDLWFTSNATGRWQIWHLESATGSFAPLTIDLGNEGSGYDHFVPAVSPEGAKIAFSAGICAPTGRCARDLYMADADGGNVQRLTHSALDEYHPTWSPDGSLIAYHAGIARAPSDAGIDYGIWMLDLAMGQSRQVTDKMDYDPVWSPSGRYIACHTMLSEAPAWGVKVLDCESGPPTINGADSWIAFKGADISTSPTWINDHQIAFAAHVNGRWNLFELPVKAGKSYINPHQLTHNGWNNVYPSVFDGRLLIWQAFRHEQGADEGSLTDRDAEIWVMDVADGVEVPLLTGVGNLRDGHLTVPIGVF